MLKKILIVLVVVVIGVVGFASTKPDTFEVHRSATMKAPAAKVFGLISDFHNWGSWSPWEKLDPAMKKTNSGAPSGKGAIYEWEGNDQVGKGRMEITDMTAPSKIIIKLDFFKPFEAHNTAEYTIETKGDSCEVTWGMHGPQPLMAKVMCLFMNMDAMIGKDFERGLGNLKTLAEK